jgi:hypothetical protein
MRSDRWCQFPTIWLLTCVGERYKPVDTVAGAAEILLHEWPSTVGKAYLNALEACLRALQDRGPTDAVPEALMRAADEAFMCYIRVIKGEKRFRVQRKRMSRQRHAFQRGLRHPASIARRQSTRTGLS